MKPFCWKGFFVSFLLLASGFGVVAEEPEKQPGSEAAAPSTPGTEWRIWLEPRFMHSPAIARIPDAEKTEIAAGIKKGSEFTPFSDTAFSALHTAWPAYFAKARENSAADLASLKPQYVRNKKKVIEYAVLKSEEPIVASAVLAPKFLSIFENTLGPKVLVALPNAFTAYVFPSLTTDMQGYAPVLRQDYDATAYPVTMEILEFSAQGIRAIGVFDDP